MEYLVCNSDYPFEETLGLVSADTAEQALEQAVKLYKQHVVVEPVNFEGKKQ